MIDTVRYQLILANNALLRPVDIGISENGRVHIAMQDIHFSRRLADTVWQRRRNIVLLQIRKVSIMVIHRACAGRDQPRPDFPRRRNDVESPDNVDRGIQDRVIDAGAEAGLRRLMTNGIGLE